MDSSDLERELQQVLVDKHVAPQSSPPPLPSVPVSPLQPATIQQPKEQVDTGLLQAIAARALVSTRAFFQTEEFKDLPNLTEFTSGVRLCQFLVNTLIPNFLTRVHPPRIPACEVEYPPIAKAIAEKQNISEFILSAKDLFPTALKDVFVQPNDLQDNLPRFLHFCLCIARAAGYDVTSNHLRSPSQQEIHDATTMSVMEIQTHLLPIFTTMKKQATSTSTHEVSISLQFLTPLGLAELSPDFDQQGFDTVEAIANMTEDDLQSGIGIQKRGIIRKILAARRDLAQSLQKTRNGALATGSSIIVGETTFDPTPSHLHQQAHTLLTRHEIRAGDPMEEKMVYEACWVANHLTSLLRGAMERALVVDLAPAGASAEEGAWLVWVGIAGENAPSARMVVPPTGSTDSVLSALKRALDSGVFSPSEMKKRPVFMVVPTPTRAVADVAFHAGITNVYMAGAMSSASLVLTGVGLLDGLMLDVDEYGIASCVALVNAVPLMESRITAKGLRLARDSEDDDATQRPAIDALVGLCRHCVSSLRNSVVASVVRDGGVVLSQRTVTAFAHTSLSIELAALFACGCHVEMPHTRWCSASRVANAPEFGNRWFTADKFSGEALRDGTLFPLLSDSARHEAATAALRVAKFCVDKLSIRGKMEEELVMAKVHAMNAINDTLPEFTSFEEGEEGEHDSPPPKSTTMHPGASVNFNQPGLEHGNRLLMMIQPLLPKDAFEDAKLYMLERFANGDFTLLDAADAVQVLQMLPEGIHERALLGAGVTRLDDTGEFVL